jgi:hypothetical protein
MGAAWRFFIFTINGENVFFIAIPISPNFAWFATAAKRSSAQAGSYKAEQVGGPAVYPSMS